MRSNGRRAVVDPRGRIGYYIIPVAVDVELRIRILPFKQRNSNKYLICGSFPNNCRSTAILSAFANIMITTRGWTDSPDPIQMCVANYCVLNILIPSI